jgi:hypothetical protein
VVHLEGTYRLEEYGDTLPDPDAVVLEKSSYDTSDCYYYEAKVI